MPRFSYWHEADIENVYSNVRFRGNSGRDALGLSISLVTQLRHQSRM